jgi:hypothetical protein
MSDLSQAWTTANDLAELKNRVAKLEHQIAELIPAVTALVAAMAGRDNELSASGRYNWKPGVGQLPRCDKTASVAARSDAK